MDHSVVESSVDIVLESHDHALSGDMDLEVDIGRSVEISIDVKFIELDGGPRFVKRRPKSEKTLVPMMEVICS
jgi:hypothetical protein